MAGTPAYLFATTSLDALMATVASSMPQFGLLRTAVSINMTLHSELYTPLETLPPLLQVVLQVSPAVHFAQFAHGVLFRGAGVDIVWLYLLALLSLGVLFTGFSLMRFRAMLALRS